MGLQQILFTLLISIDKFWHYVIISVGNKEVKISNIILASIGIYFASKYYKKIILVIVNRLVENKYDENRELIQKVISIFFSMMLTIIILQLINVPLETFAFFGGALALGVGLGIQNLINNLLSSFIIMIEKPFKVGDLITVDKYTGIVEEVANRCIITRSPSNAIIIIPSSTVIQNRLINWSNNDFLIYDMKIQIPKEVCQDYSIQELIPQIIEKSLASPELISSKVGLKTITAESYVYQVTYKLKKNVDMINFQHMVNNYLIKHLGSTILVEHLDQVPS